VTLQKVLAAWIVDAGQHFEALAIGIAHAQ
jgi:hypothetical protein